MADRIAVMNDGGRAAAARRSSSTTTRQTVRRQSSVAVHERVDGVVRNTREALGVEMARGPVVPSDGRR